MRILPFFAAFAVAVFITSFFVDISRPRFRGGRWKMHHEMERLQFENDQLREENGQLREQLATGQIAPQAMNVPYVEKIPSDVRVPLAPPPPIAPIAPRVRH